MARNHWIEEMPSPWDMDCRGKVCIYKHEFDPEAHVNRGATGKYQILGEIRKQLDEEGKIQFFETNGIDFYKSIKITVVQNFHLRTATIAVLIDMPYELRTLYKLAFKE